jgi:hypothetical protein
MNECSLFAHQAELPNMRIEPARWRKHVSRIPTPVREEAVCQYIQLSIANERNQQDGGIPTQTHHGRYKS